MVPAMGQESIRLRLIYRTRKSDRPLFPSKVMAVGTESWACVEIGTFHQVLHGLRLGVNQDQLVDYILGYVNSMVFQNADK